MLGSFLLEKIMGYEHFKKFADYYVSTFPVNNESNMMLYNDIIYFYSQISDEPYENIRKYIMQYIYERRVK